jgi:hypothetical protein
LQIGFVWHFFSCLRGGGPVWRVPFLVRQDF